MLKKFDFYRPLPIIISIFAVVLVLHFDATLLASTLYSRKIDSTFFNEDKTLGSPVVMLGLGIASDQPVTQCLAEQDWIFKTKFICTRMLAYNSNGGTVSAKTLEAYKLHTVAVVAALNKNGWTYDNKTEYENSTDQISNVAYHKNIGSISCNFKVSASDNDYAAKPSLKSRIFVNQYLCQDHITLPTINFYSKKYHTT